MKRLFDFTVSLLMIIVLFPLMFIIGLIIVFDDGFPVIFKQYRVGKDNKLFYIYKFRTMKKETRNVATEELSEADQMITKSGRLLRKMSLDELPQLFNIISGKMSFVGPRPLIPEEKEIRELRLKYNVYSVRPGMTGLAQINGRDAISYQQKAEYDKEYVENRNFFYDIKIIIKTVFAVLSAKDVVEGSESTNKRVQK